jgi:hypothetical protein
MHITWYVLNCGQCGALLDTQTNTSSFSAQNNCLWAQRFCQGKYRVNWAICQTFVSGWLLVVITNHLRLVLTFSSSLSLGRLHAVGCAFSGAIPDSIFSMPSLCKSLILRERYTYLFGPPLPFYFSRPNSFAKFGL